MDNTCAKVGWTKWVKATLKSNAMTTFWTRWMSSERGSRPCDQLGLLEQVMCEDRFNADKPNSNSPRKM